MKKPQLSRRQFLKLASVASLSALSPRQLTESAGQPNILIVVFDAWSAKHLGMLGYQRDTMPRLTSLSERAIVYHNHYAGGPWTIPGTASLLTGTYPWTHRAFNAENIRLAMPKRNVFKLAQESGYTTAAATHNIFADDFLTQFNRWLDIHSKFTELFLPVRFPFTRLFPRDLEASALAQIRAFWNKADISSSLFFADFLKANVQADMDQIEAQYGSQFTYGVPQTPVPQLPFLLEDGIDHLLGTVSGLQQPYMSYYHFYPPHQPYRPRAEFTSRYRNDGAVFPEKPPSIISEDEPEEKTKRERDRYDQFLDYVDAEFYRLYQTMEASGQLENTWLVLTSDHGELFERGNIGHETPMGYEGEVRVPLILFPPGGGTRKDVFELTSAVDVMPTLLHLADLPVPDWVEGVVLPPFGSSLPADRSVYVLHPKRARSRRPISQGSVTIVREDHKLIYSFGMKDLGENDPYFELYDLAADPEELDNLYTESHLVAKRLLAEIQAEINRADQPYK